MMVHADTNGLMDKCHCGAVAGFEQHPYECRVRARCTECCEQTEYQLDNFRAAHAWNLRMRSLSNTGRQVRRESKQENS